MVFDDYTAITAMGANNGFWWARDVQAALVAAMRDCTVQGDRRMVISGRAIEAWESVAQLHGEAAILIEAEPLRPDDYAALLELHWGSAASAIDFAMVHRAAPALDLYQLELLGNLLRHNAQLTTADVLTCLEADILFSNLRIAEVEELLFESLPGTENIAKSLESHIILPFQNKKLADELGIKPRRGVLLYGPPGTGKTSIGRALAHRMKGRFFLIDGTFITEPPGSFFGMVDAVVRDAKANAPSVLFIDDADVLFQIEHIAGLSRYLLSLLDGLESETANNVCVVLTAMDAQKVPEALLRSGRIELWLETKAPDEANRAKIIERWLASDMAALGAVDYDLIARVTEGFTPADLRRLASDAKLLYAADIVAERPMKSVNDYLLTAIDELVATRAIMADRFADDALRIRAYA